MDIQLVVAVWMTAYSVMLTAGAWAIGYAQARRRLRPHAHDPAACDGCASLEAGAFQAWQTVLGLGYPSIKPVGRDTDLSPVLTVRGSKTDTPPVVTQAGGAEGWHDEDLRPGERNRLVAAMEQTTLRKGVLLYCAGHGCDANITASRNGNEITICHDGDTVEYTVDPMLPSELLVAQLTAMIDPLHRPTQGASE